MTDISYLTFEQQQELKKLLQQTEKEKPIYKSIVGKKCIVNQQWYGIVERKEGEEVLIKNPQRINLSLEEEVVTSSGALSISERIWIKATEIIPCTEEAIKEIEKL